MQALLDRLREPGLAGVALDGPVRFAAHRRVLERKRMLRDVFEECRRTMRRLAQAHLAVEGRAVEIGAGVAPMRDSYPEVLATDVVHAPHLDLVVDAQAMPVRDASLGVVYAQNAFHHLPRPERFFRELVRVLTPGGGAVLLEPAHGLLASWLYPRLFASEGFDKRHPSWDTPQSGPMNGANQALAYVVFVRDRERFQRAHPELEIVAIEPMRNGLRYLLSGGLNFRQLVPDAANGALRALESLVAPAAGALALHQVIVLRKRAGA
jgi:SAM-dependent methyltransferase